MAVKEILSQAESAGFRSIDSYTKLAAGDKVYWNQKNKAVVLSLILILWLRERIYEIGILLSIGVSKFKIVTQFIMELIFISLPAMDNKIPIS